MSRATKDDSGSDYDPATGETLYDSKGNPITQEYLDEVAAEAEAGYNLSELAPARGRPSLAGRGESPQVRFRLPTDLRERATQRARAEGKSVSQLAREALERYLAS
jgi:hypothetical protein